MNKQYVVIDVISTDMATLLVGEGEKEWVVRMDELPGGSKEGDWLILDAEGNLLPAPEKARERKEKIRSKLDQIRANKG